MRNASDTTLRYLGLLQLIPSFPNMISVTQLQKKLRGINIDFSVDVRTIQRDLEKLSASFPLSCETKGRANYWFWTDKSAMAHIPAMSSNTALAFKLAAEHLTKLMPPSTLRLLAPYFKHAGGILQQTKLGKWSAKTRIIGRGPQLIAPTIKPKTQKVVYEALLDDKQFAVDYQSKERGVSVRQVLNPLGIVLKNGIIYLVATAGEYEHPRHYVLHRMSRAVLLEQKAKSKADFDFARYVEQDKTFSYPVSGKKIKLHALFSEDAAFHLSESKLSEDQTIINKKDGRMLVKATINDTMELRWWLLGFGSNVEVMGPNSLRQEFVELTAMMKYVYNGDGEI